VFNNTCYSASGNLSVMEECTDFVYDQQMFESTITSEVCAKMLSNPYLNNVYYVERILHLLNYI